jgi:hypothetical protein
MKTCLIRRGQLQSLALALAGSLGIVLAQNASSQVIINDNFSSYTDDASLLATWARASGSSSTIFLSTDPGNAANPTIQQTTAAGRLRETITGVVPTDANPLVFSFDLYDPNGGSANGRVYSEVRNSAAATGLFAAGIYNSVNTGVLDITKFQARDVDSGGWIQLAAPRSVGWHNFRFEISGTTADLYVDHVLDPNFTDRPYTGNVTYDWVHLGSALTGNTAAQFDNVYVAVVPEPSTVALLLLGGLSLGLAVRARRSN